jgi:uncharacterized membrane protein
MKLGVSAFAERVRGSLFVIPMLFVIVAIVLGQLGILLDSTIGSGTNELPLGLTSTVESARAVLSTVAGATITFAGIAFSVSLLTIQLASSQYSPRVVSGLFRDPFNKRVIGVVIGTFSYCLIVLRSVRSSLEQQGDPVIPNVSVAVAVILGITSILAIIAFIDHNAHAMEISKILDVVTHDAVGAVDRHWSFDALEPSVVQQPDVLPVEPGFVVPFERDGWVQLLDAEALLEAVPEGGVVRLDTAVGRFAIKGSAFCTLWPAPPDPAETARMALGAVHLGETRTLQQDASYGIRQLADVALKALSPGVNDPTTAQDAIFHLAALLREFLLRDEPLRDLTHEDRRLVLAQAEAHEQILGLAYDEVRLAAASLPAVSIYLLESMSLLRDALPPERERAQYLLDQHARLVLEAVKATELSRHDRQQVEHIYARHFDVVQTP